MVAEVAASNPIPNAKELEVIKKVRDQIVDVSQWDDIQDDGFMLRWIRAKDMNVEATKTGLLANYKWRQENGMDTILEDYTPDPELTKLTKYEHVGQDKQNCPVIVADVESYNPRKILKKYKDDELIRFGLYHVEKMRAEMKKLSTKEMYVQQVVGIVDAKKFTFKQMTAPGGAEIAIKGLKIALDNYPGAGKLLVVVNAPRIAKLAYKIAKPFVPERDMKNVKIYPKVNAKVKKFLLERINADQLPEKYGGTLKMGDESVVDKAITEDDDDISGNPEDLEETDMVEVKVASGKKLKLEYNIDEPGTQICWSFQTDDRDIGFSVYVGEKENTIVPYQKFESLSLQNSSIMCEKIGKYTLCFNNKENRFRSCTLSYVVQVFPPDVDI